MSGLLRYLDSAQYVRTWFLRCAPLTDTVTLTWSYSELLSSEIAFSVGLPEVMRRLFNRPSKLLQTTQELRSTTPRVRYESIDPPGEHRRSEFLHTRDGHTGTLSPTRSSALVNQRSQ
jgi:hypothetical protein